MLTAAQVRQVLPVDERELSELIAAGWLRPCSADDACYPAGQVEALLHSRRRVPGDLRPGFLRALSQTLPAGAGVRPRRQIRWDGQHPYLRIRTSAGAQLLVWLVPTLAGWRFLWNRYRSHPAADLVGAATAITIDLS